MTLLYSLLILVVLCLLVARANTVIDAYDDWNYYMHRYRNYCAVNEERPSEKVEKNSVSKTEALIVFLSIWKMDSHFYFSYKPDFKEIVELYFNRK